MAEPGGADSICPACGEPVDRREGREYDKEASPWSLRGARTERFCRACFRALDHTPRDGLETRLVDLDAGHCDRETFLRRYFTAGRERHGRRGDRP